MKQNKLVELLSKCTSKERIALKDFIHSPYFVKDEAITKLIEYLLDHFEDMPQLKEDFFQIAYSNMVYDDKKYRYLISNSAKVISHFWKIRNYENNESQKLLDELSIFSQKNLEKSFQQTLRKWERLEESNDYLSSEYYINNVRFQEARYTDLTKTHNRQLDDIMINMVNAYDRYYYFHRIASACEMLNRESIFQKNYNRGLPPEWFKYLEKENFFNDLLLEAYYWMWKILNDPNENVFFQHFIAQIKSLPISTNIEDSRPLYQIAVNYALRKLRAGKKEYQKIALELYIEGIDKNVVLDNNQLSPWIFGNIVKLAIKEKDPSWVEQFIEEKSSLLPPAHYDNALNYNLAELYYATQQYDKAQQSLAFVEFTDLNYYLGTRILLAKIYFENEEIEPLLSLINAFNIFLKRNKKISANIKETCLNFCKILYQIVRANEKRMKVLREEITTSRLLAERDWLLKQYDKLMN